MCVLDINLHPVIVWCFVQCVSFVAKHYYSTPSHGRQQIARLSPAVIRQFSLHLPYFPRDPDISPWTCSPEHFIFTWCRTSPLPPPPRMRVSASFPKILRSVSRLGLGLGSGPHVVGRLGLAVWVNASFQNFALTAGGGNVLHYVKREGKCPGGNCPGRNCPGEERNVLNPFPRSLQSAVKCTWREGNLI